MRVHGPVDAQSLGIVLRAGAAHMMGLPAGTRIWIAAGHTDMRKGFDLGLAALVQTALAANPHSGQVFVFRGRRGDIIKSTVVRWPRPAAAGQAAGEGSLCGRRPPRGSVSLTPAQLSCCSKASDAGACPLVFGSPRWWV